MAIRLRPPALLGVLGVCNASRAGAFEALLQNEQPPRLNLAVQFRGCGLELGFAGLAGLREGCGAKMPNLSTPRREHEVAWAASWVFVQRFVLHAAVTS